MNIEKEFSDFLTKIYKGGLPLHEDQYRQLRNTWFAATSVVLAKLGECENIDELDNFGSVLHKQLLKFVEEGKSK